MHNRLYSFANLKVRNATALLVLVSICASALPIPLGRIIPQSKDLSQPFPCQHCPCGCKSAEQCWKGCCCFTPAQKAAWAKKNGVTPPAYAILEDDEQLAESGKIETQSCSKSCCHKKAASSSELEMTKSESTEPIIVLSIMAYKCSGQANIFSLLPWAIIVIQPDTALGWELYGRQASDDSFNPIRVFLFPDVPPPRTLG